MTSIKVACLFSLEQQKLSVRRIRFEFPSLIALRNGCSPYVWPRSTDYSVCTLDSSEHVLHRMDLQLANDLEAVTTAKVLLNGSMLEVRTGAQNGSACEALNAPCRSATDCNRTSIT